MLPWNLLDGVWRSNPAIPNEPRLRHLQSIKIVVTSIIERAFLESRKMAPANLFLHHQWSFMPILSALRRVSASTNTRESFWTRVLWRQCGKEIKAILSSNITKRELHDPDDFDLHLKKERWFLASLSSTISTPSKMLPRSAFLFFSFRQDSFSFISHSFRNHKINSLPAQDWYGRGNIMDFEMSLCDEVQEVCSQFSSTCFLVSLYGENTVVPKGPW